jgi:hypothetical protein
VFVNLCAQHQIEYVVTCKLFVLLYYLLVVAIQTGGLLLFLEGALKRGRKPVHVHLLVS